MGFRFRRRLRIFPGLYLNVSKSGVSTSIGGHGATLNVTKRGTRTTIGLPGFGAFLTLADRALAGTNRCSLQDTLSPQPPFAWRARKGHQDPIRFAWTNIFHANAA